jgi:hypothetical protein
LAAPPLKAADAPKADDDDAAAADALARACPAADGVQYGHTMHDVVRGPLRAW